MRQDIKYGLYSTDPDAGLKRLLDLKGRTRADTFYVTNDNKASFLENIRNKIKQV